MLACTSDSVDHLTDLPMFSTIKYAIIWSRHLAMFGETSFHNRLNIYPWFDLLWLSMFRYHKGLREPQLLTIYWSCIRTA